MNYILLFGNLFYISIIRNHIIIYMRGKFFNIEIYIKEILYSRMKILKKYIIYKYIYMKNS